MVSERKNQVFNTHNTHINTNPAEMMLTPEQFAEVLCDDLDLPPSSFAGPIAQSIRQQCDQFSTDMIPEDEEDRRVVVKVREMKLSCHTLCFD